LPSSLSLPLFVMATPAVPLSAVPSLDLTAPAAAPAAAASCASAAGSNAVPVNRVLFSEDAAGAETLYTPPGWLPRNGKMA